jgi:hypothetical protein
LVDRAIVTQLTADLLPAAGIAPGGWTIGMRLAVLGGVSAEKLEAGGGANGAGPPAGEPVVGLGVVAPPPAKSAKKSTTDLDGDDVVYRDGTGLEQRLMDYQVLMRVSPAERHRDLGISPQLGTLDGESTQKLLQAFMYREGVKEPGTPDASGWRSVTWLENVRAAAVWTSADTFLALIQGDVQPMQPARIDIRAFRPEGLFQVRGEQVAEADFRLKVNSSLLGFENTLRGLGGDAYKGCTLAIREVVGENGGASRGITESMLWWKVNSALGEWFTMLRRASPAEIRRAYPTLPPSDDGSEKVKGPRVTAALLSTILGEVILTNCLPTSTEGATFMARCWPDIDWGKAKGGKETPAKGGKEVSTVTPTSAGKGAPVRQGHGPQNKWGVCAPTLRLALGETKNTDGSAVTKCSRGAQDCTKWHVLPTKASKASVLQAIAEGNRFRGEDTLQGRKLTALVQKKM